MSTAFAADKPVEDVIDVRISVAGSNENLQENLRHQLKKSLEEFSAINATYDDAPWEISVIVSTGDSGRLRNNFNFSVLFLKPSEYRHLDEIVDHHLMLDYPNLQSGAERIALYFIETCLQRKVDAKYKRRLNR